MINSNGCYNMWNQSTEMIVASCGSPHWLECCCGYQKEKWGKIMKNWMMEIKMGRRRMMQHSHGVGAIWGLKLTRGGKKPNVKIATNLRVNGRKIFSLDDWFYHTITVPISLCFATLPRPVAPFTRPASVCDLSLLIQLSPTRFTLDQGPSWIDLLKSRSWHPFIWSASLFHHQMPDLVRVPMF